MMRPLVLGVGLFVVTMVAHVTLWRLLRPRRDYRALLWLCVSTLILGVAGSITVGRLRPGSPFALSGGLEYGTFVLLYAAVLLSYVSTYPGIQADSPSMFIALKIEEAGAAGRSLADLDAAFPDEVFLVPRVNDLVAGGLVSHVRGRYVIRGSGSRIARVHVLYRRVLRMERGG